MGIISETEEELRKMPYLKGSHTNSLIPSSSTEAAFQEAHGS